MADSYHRIEKGIAIYGGRFRAFAVINGKPEQRYFDTIEDARHWRRSALKESLGEGVAGVTASRKKGHALYKDLPIGLTQSTTQRHYPSGAVSERNVIRSFVYIDAKPVKCLTAAFGKIRSRDEAIAIVIKKRERYYQENGLDYCGRWNHQTYE